MTVVKESREQASISLLPRHKRALDWMADQNGNDQRSLVVRELIEREMRARLGSDWHTKLLRLEDGHES
jgi:hypothetical protein